MGNGPGGLLEYVALFRSEPLLQGGLVWEWNNHGLLKREGDLEYYAYGGDFGDYPNDADFIMDGLTLSTHDPMPSLGEYAKVIQSIGVSLNAAKDQMVVTNYYDFSDLSHLDVTWHLVRDGEELTEAKTLDLPRVPAGENRTVSLPTSNTTQEAWLTVEFKLKNDAIWADAGHVVAWDQLHLEAPSRMEPRVTHGRVSARQSDWTVTQDGANLEVKSGSSTFGFDLLQGNVTWNADGVDILRRGPELYFYRAMTQNDMGQSGDMAEWDDTKVGMMHTQVRDVSWAETDDGIEVHYSVLVAPKVLEWGVEATLVYSISAEEPGLRVHATGEFVGKNTPSVVPRIGLMAVMPSSFDAVSWFGRGPGESYKDSKQACRVGRYEATVEDLFQHYDYPQENGNREDLRWLQIGDGSVSLRIRRTEDKMPFSFTARRYMPSDLDDATHPHDLEELDMTVLNLDYDNHGLGSASVGPRPFDQYKCKTEPFEFGFEIVLVSQ